jgi:hypothetical protein
MVLRDSKPLSYTSNGISVPDTWSAYIIEIKRNYQIKGSED